MRKIYPSRQEYLRVYRIKNKEKAAKRYQENRERIRAEAKAKYRENPEKIKAKQKEWCAKNKEKKRAMDAAYREKNKEAMVQKNREYYQKNKEKCAATNKAWAAKNKKKSNGIKRAYAERNPEKVKKSKDGWRERNPDRVFANVVNRRARKKASPEELKKIAAWRKAWKSKAEVECGYCFALGDPKTFHVDHINPLGLDGKHELKNLYIACPSCNLKKSKMPIEEWLLKMPDIWLDRELASNKNLDTAQIENLRQRQPLVKLLAGMMLDCSVHSRKLSSAAYEVQADASPYYQA